MTSLLTSGFLRARHVVALVIGCLMAVGLAAQSLQVIDLKYRTAAEVIPVLQPLLEPGGALTGQDYKLFVRASRGNVEQLRKALAQIDRQPRQFLVAVRRATRQQIEREQASVSGTVNHSGAGVSLSTGGSADRRESNGVASVNVIEGNAAFIATGQSVPVVTAVVIGGGSRPRVGMSNSYRDLTTGFTVTPRLAGEQVVLNIEQQAEQRAPDGTGIQTHKLSTQISGKLGEWLPLGGVSESSRNQNSGIASGGLATRSDETEVWVRVTASL